MPSQMKPISYAQLGGVHQVSPTRLVLSSIHT